MSYGKPIVSVVDALGNREIKRVYLFIIDGCRADIFYSAFFEENLFPQFRRYIDRGYRYFPNCYTAFPAVTLPCHSALLTGTFPGTHGVVGNNWFRQTYDKPILADAHAQYVRFGTENNPGLFRHFDLANGHLGNVSTLFESYRKKTRRDDCYAVFEMINRGTPPSHVKHLLWGLLARLTRRLVVFEVISYLKGRKEHLSLAMDHAALYETEKLLRTRAPALIVTWLPGMDGFSHNKGANLQLNYMKTMTSLDKLWAKLMATLKRKGLLEESLVVITADHGQYQCEAEEETQSYRISLVDLYRNIHDHKIDPAYKRLLPVRVSDGFIQLRSDARNYSIVFAPNGGMSHVYVAELQDSDRLFWAHKERWKNPSYMQILQQVCSSFADYRGIDLILVRSSETEYKVWDQKAKSMVSLNSLDKRKFPLAHRRVPPLAQSIRSGDIMLIADPGFYFSDKTYKGEHGTLASADSHVPLLFLSPAFRPSSEVCDEPVCVVDIAPTVAKLMGFLDELRASPEYSPLSEVDVRFLNRDIMDEMKNIDKANTEFEIRLQDIKSPEERNHLSNLGKRAITFMKLSLSNANFAGPGMFFPYRQRVDKDPEGLLETAMFLQNGPISVENSIERQIMEYEFDVEKYDKWFMKD